MFYSFLGSGYYATTAPGSIVNLDGLSVSLDGRTQVGWGCRELPSQVDMSISANSAVKRMRRIARSGAETPYKSATLPYTFLI